MNVIVVGANRGIGLALVSKLVKDGNKVWATTRKPSTDLDSFGDGVTVIDGVDISDNSLPELLANTFVGVTFDMAIINAGVLAKETLEFDASKETMKSVMRQFDVNALGHLRSYIGLQNCLKKGSKIGFITSRMGSIGDNTSGGMYGYRMSKAALNMFGKSLALDLKEQGIAVAILHPGLVETDMTSVFGVKAGVGPCVSTEDSANGLLLRMKELNMSTSGTFWHMKGHVLPW